MDLRSFTCLLSSQSTQQMDVDSGIETMETEEIESQKSEPRNKRKVCLFCTCMLCIGIILDSLFFRR
jgi:hypothetical protein